VGKRQKTREKAEHTHPIKPGKRQRANDDWDLIPDIILSYVSSSKVLGPLHSSFLSGSDLSCLGPCGCPLFFPWHLGRAMFLTHCIPEGRLIGRFMPSTWKGSCLTVCLCWRWNTLVWW
jgi:hypothetical protein